MAKYPVIKCPPHHKLNFESPKICFYRPKKKKRCMQDACPTLYLYQKRTALFYIQRCSFFFSLLDIRKNVQIKAIAFCGCELNGQAKVRRLKKERNKNRLIT